MSFQVEYFSGIIAGQVTLDHAKLQNTKYVSGQISPLLPEGMVLDYALVKKQDNLVLVVPKRLLLQMKFPKEQRVPTLSPCGKFVASGSYDQTVKVWNLETQECITLEGHTNWVHCVVFSPCGKFLVSGGDDKTVKVWNLETQECMTLEGHTAWVFCVVFSPCGKFVASGSDDQTVKVWNLETQECMTLEGHTDGVWCVAFSPCG
jgi:uncharacterized protein with WD repeat